MAPEKQNGERKINDFTGGSDSIGGIPSPEVEMPPDNPSGICAPNDTFGHIGDSGGILENALEEKNNSPLLKTADLPKSYFGENSI
jgi:hypothetical protein